MSKSGSKINALYEKLLQSYGASFFYVSLKDDTVKVGIAPGLDVLSDPLFHKAIIDVFGEEAGVAILRQAKQIFEIVSFPYPSQV